MKKILFPFSLLLGLGAGEAAHAQTNLIRMGMNSVTLARRLRNGNGQQPAGQNAAAPNSYEGREFPMVRTTPTQLPKKGGEQITAMETELDRCHAAMLASPTGTICTPEQRVAIQTAIVNLARANSSKNLPDYQQEASFYLAEDARRQQVAATAPAK